MILRQPFPDDTENTLPTKSKPSGQKFIMMIRYTRKNEVQGKHRPGGLAGLWMGAIFSALAAVASLHAVSVSPSEGHFVDGFDKESEAWRDGSAIISGDGKGLALTAKLPEATLSGMALNPDSLRCFKAMVRIRFGGTGQPVLNIGWGKPYEWSDFGESRFRVSVTKYGVANLYADGLTLGPIQLKRDADGICELTVEQTGQRVALVSSFGSVVHKIAEGREPKAGYLALKAEGLVRVPNEEPLRIQGIEIVCQSAKTPLSREDREKEIRALAASRQESNEEVLAGFKKHIADETKAGRWGFATALKVSPQLVHVGEKVSAEFRTRGPLPAPCEAWIEPDFLGAKPGGEEPLALDWQPAPDGGYVARAEIDPRKAGNWRVVWKAGQERMSRLLAVVGSGYTVCRLLLTSHKGPWIPGHVPEAYDVIHDYGLTADYWSMDEWKSPYTRSPEELLKRYAFFSQVRHKWGDHVMPMANANWIIPNFVDANLWRLDDEIQRRGISQASRLWDMLGIGPLEILGSYTVGHTTPRIAREEGVKVIDSLVQWQNWRDGGSDNGWLINHWGAPTVPYFVADDDFRKVAPGKSILAFGQATTSSVRIYDIMTTEGQPQLNLRRAQNESMGESMNIDRFEATVDLWLAEAEAQPEPLFVSVGMENFLNSPDWNEANILGVRYLREQALTRKLVFASAADIAEYFERNYKVQPENWLYWPDVYAGQRGAYKPALVPDRIEMSNRRFHSVHEQDVSLPRFLWDFSNKWSEPVWDNQSAIRKKYGLVAPDLLTAENCIPRMADLTGVHVAVSRRRAEEALEISVEIETPRALSSLPVALWNVPLGLSWKVKDISEGVRFVPIVDGSSGNSHGLLVGENIGPGKIRWKVVLQGLGQKVRETQIAIGNDVKGRLFYRGDAPRAYLWLCGEHVGSLSIPVPAGRTVSVHYNDGSTEISRDGMIRITLDKAWLHQSPLVYGLDAAELSLGSFTAEP